MNPVCKHARLRGYCRACKAEPKRSAGPWYVLFLPLGPALMFGCALLGERTPAEYASDALAAEAVTHESATYACAAYERAVVARAIKPDAKVSGRCAALR
jgi:hypothetical protein